MASATTRVNRHRVVSDSLLDLGGGASGGCASGGCASESEVAGGSPEECAARLDFMYL
jgi:hypothetical protein